MSPIAKNRSLARGISISTVALPALLLFLNFTCAANAAVVKVVKTGDGFELQVDGKPYFVKGGGGDGAKDLLAQCGGNSFRTWGVGADTQASLDDAKKNGLTVTLGIWLPHKFNWNDAGKVQEQVDNIKKVVTKYKDDPTVLCWAIGNEMESEGGDKPELWKAIEEMAKAAHELDPNHPTMTVVAEIGRDGNKLAEIKQYCPDIDIVGVNTYGGGASLAERYKKADVGKPYMLTEFGPAGTWETPKNAFKAANELTSTEKADSYQTTYEKSVLGEKNLCLGSYAFTWGFKHEATATWFGLLLADGSKLAGVDALTQFWMGKPPAVLCPVISKIKFETPDQAAPGSTLKASVDTSDPQKSPLTIQWVLAREMSTYNVQGAGAAATTDYSSGIVKNGMPSVEIKLPDQPGVYRLYCYVRNAAKSAATASAPIQVK